MSEQDDLERLRYLQLKQKAQGSGDIQPPVEPPMSVGGLAENAINDVADIAKGTGAALKMLAKAPVQPMMTLAKTGVQLYRGAPLRNTEIGQQASALGDLVVASLPHPNPEKPLAFKNLEPGALLENVLHPYDHPLKAALDVASVVAPIASSLKAADATAAFSKTAELTKAAEAIPELRSAIKLKGRMFTGNPGDIHIDVINKMAKELGVDPGAIYDQIGFAGEMGFANKGEFLSRAEASAKTGVAGEAASMRAKGKLGIDTGAAPVTPVEKAAEKASLTYLEKKAQDFGVSALGYGKGLLKSPRAVAKARETAQIMLDKGVISEFSTPETMAEKARALADTHGQAIGDYLESVGQRGKFFDPKQSIAEINQLRPKTEAGKLLKGGHYNAINSKIDAAIDTIKAHGTKELSFEEANKLKGTLQDAANWNNNKDATILDKMIAGRFRESVDNALNKVSNTDMNKASYKKFLEDKKVYSAAVQAQDPLYNRISAHLSNNKMSLTDFVLAAPEIAMGNSARAIGLLGGKKVAQAFGAQTASSLLNKAKNLNVPASKAPAILKALETAGNKTPESDSSLLDLINNTPR